MITEIRHILFQDEDLLRATVEYRKKRNQPLPAGSIVEFKIERDHPMSCTVKIYSEKDGDTIDVLFDQEEMRSALVAYCMYKRIPMPAGVKKDLQMFGDRVGLFFALNTSREEMDVLRRVAG